MPRCVVYRAFGFRVSDDNPVWLKRAVVPSSYPEKDWPYDAEAMTPRGRSPNT
jgi:hypothetical protein